MPNAERRSSRIAAISSRIATMTSASMALREAMRIESEGPSLRSKPTVQSTSLPMLSPSSPYSKALQRTSLPTFDEEIAQEAYGDLVEKFKK